MEQGGFSMFNQKGSPDSTSPKSEKLDSIALFAVLLSILGFGILKLFVRTSSTETNRQVFYYTNIAPQLSSGFNTGGGGWNLLEDFIDTVVPADTLYEVVGCYFERYTDGYGHTVAPKTISFGGRKDVAFPTMYYYAVLRTKKGNTRKSVTECSADELQCVAFVRSHTNSLKGQKPSSRELMSISDLEKITGFTYFSNVPNAPKSTYKASDWGL